MIQEGWHHDTLSIMEELIASEERRKSFDCDEPGDDDEGAASQVDLADDAEILR